MNALTEPSSRIAPQEVKSVNALKRYKPSRFNVHTGAPDGSVILHNTFTGHTCVIPAAGAGRVAGYLSRKGFEGTLDKLGAYLFDSGYLLDASVDEAVKWDVTYANLHYRSDVLRLVLLANEDCNFRCVYCSQPFQHGTMTPAVRTGIRRYFENHVAKLRYVGVGWFGGEPLLGYEAIEELAPFFQESCKKYDVAFQSNITTNGYLLTPERSRNMIRWGVQHFQITIDGMPEDHNRKRVLKDGGPTFDRIMENVAAMRCHEEPFSVRLRVNFDRDNVGHLEAFFELVKERLGGDTRFQIAFNAVGRWNGPQDSKLDVITCGILDRQKSLRESARDLGIPFETCMSNARAGRILCHASNACGFTIGADGRILKCTNHAVIPEDLNTIGKVLEDGAFQIDQDLHRKWFAPYYLYDSECKKCFYLPVCRGGLICPAARVKGLKPQCRDEKSHIRTLLLEYWQERRAAGDGKLVRVSAQA
jgi:uncharacterized protein